MCLAAPGKLLSVDGEIGKIDFGGTIREANISMVDANIGDWVVIHAGFAIQTMNEEEAKETLDLWNEFLSAETTEFK